MSANSWTEKLSTSNLKGRVLSQLFCRLMINNSLGINTNFVAGVNNIVVDTISRICPSSGSAPNLTSLIQVFLELTSCQHFHPSAELLSCLMQGLLSKLESKVNQLLILEYLTQDSDFTSLISSPQ